MGTWTQLWVKALDPSRNTPDAMRGADNGIQAAGAVFCAPDGTPVQEPDGTFEVRVYAPDSGFAEYLITMRYDLEIVKKVRHTD